MIFVKEMSSRTATRDGSRSMLDDDENKRKSKSCGNPWVFFVLVTTLMAVVIGLVLSGLIYGDVRTIYSALESPMAPLSSMKRQNNEGDYRKVQTFLIGYMRVSKRYCMMLVNY